MLPGHSARFRMSIRKALKFMKAANVVRLQPGDSLCLKLRGRVSLATMDAIRCDLARAFKGRELGPILVLDDSADLTVLRGMKTQ